ncbi:MAG: Uma2 family endonuclease [Bacteroidota bacterium]
MGAIDHHSKNYTYADYLTWPDEERWEIIHGVPYSLTPAPNRKHQEISVELSRQLANHLKGKSCKVYSAPFDVRLSEDFSDDALVETIVQPDISVFCDQKKLDEKVAKGAPDLVIEILSPSTTKKDLTTKILLYQRFLVREYWIIDPEKNIISICILDQHGKYPEAILIDDKMAEISSVAIKDFTTSLAEILDFN